ncbi:MAG: carboxylating nicotinate-nucleotide diphosphorylase [Planctomycetota bacterium]|nr:carboxylating nicotinate-nucleotide diphosphorylase [Planctomycetota bacterium]
MSQERTDLDQFWTQQETLLQLERWLRSALEEDRARDDSTRVLFDPPIVRGRAVVSSRQSGVVCGTVAMAAVFEQLDGDCQVIDRLADGQSVVDGSELLVVDGPLVSLLAGERTALNIGSHLSGIATRTEALVRRSHGVQILDTRKTLPGIRIFQKQAVRAGGGVSHRGDLAQFPMVKDNHREWLQRLNPQLADDPAAEISYIVTRLRQADDSRPIAIEVEDEISFRACLEQQVDIILVDNTTPELLGRWIDAARAAGLSLKTSAIEASGGIDEATVSGHAAAGVGRISCGAITHSAAALDLTLRIDPVPESTAR